MNNILRMVYLFLFLFLLVFINGCQLSTDDILNNPYVVEEKCDKIKDDLDKSVCFQNYAEMVARNNSNMSVNFCDNLEGVKRDKCLFEIFLILESSNRIDEAIDVCKSIKKEGFTEWCETRRNMSSITIAPSLD
ncbi:MAG: hypothetical protein V1663_05575 [archaeon]